MHCNIWQRECASPNDDFLTTGLDLRCDANRWLPSEFCTMQVMMMMMMMKMVRVEAGLAWLRGVQLIPQTGLRLSRMLPHSHDAAPRACVHHSPNQQKRCPVVPRLLPLLMTAIILREHTEAHLNNSNAGAGGRSVGTELSYKNGVECIAGSIEN